MGFILVVNIRPLIGRSGGAPARASQTRHRALHQDFGALQAAVRGVLSPIPVWGRREAKGGLQGLVRTVVLRALLFASCSPGRPTPGTGLA